MRIVYIGCVDFSYRLLQALSLTEGLATIVGVVTREQSNFNSDFCSLQDLAQQHGWPCFVAQGNDQVAIENWIRKLTPDIIFCFGWSYLLSNEILRIPLKGIIGYHPSPLPAGRGRHPIIWALALGLKNTASSFFHMDEKADTGDLLSQVHVPIQPDDDAASLYQRLAQTASQQMLKFLPLLAGEKAPRIRQNDANANSWRKRGHADGRIDWRMNAQSVHNLVRALTRPYVGAHCEYLGADCKVWRVQVLASSDADLYIEPGKILLRDGAHFIVKCGVGLLRVVEHELQPCPEVGVYL